jgi:transposase
MQVTRIGMDIAKQIFDLHRVDRRGKVTLRKTLRRERVLEFFAQLKPCEVGMEACAGAHYWHRELSRLGHTVRLLSAHKVKPYVDGNKNNRHDAAAICEAMSRPSLRFVPAQDHRPAGPADAASRPRAFGPRADRTIQSGPWAVARVRNSDAQGRGGA